VIPLLLVGVVELALAAQGQRVALELDVDIVGIGASIGAGEAIDRSTTSSHFNVATRKGSSSTRR
jgi:hypothetical protein